MLENSSIADAKLEYGGGAKARRARLLNYFGIHTGKV